jgi:hypothetical protein
MPYRCPLCLEELGSKNSLISYCSVCDRAEEFKFIPDSLASKLRCRKAKCLANRSITNGIFLAHVDCKATNPFWDEDENQISVPPDTLDGKKITLQFTKGAKSFVHWQINLLNKTSKSGHQYTSRRSENGAVQTQKKLISQIREMWFPAILLRATGEKRTVAAGKKRFGQVVSLVGVKSAGKTILALQALDKQGYLGYHTVEKIDIEDYVYSHHKKGETVQPIFDLLRIRSQMERDDHPFYMPLPNTRASTNLYSVFFSPTEKALRAAPAVVEQTNKEKVGLLEQFKKLNKKIDEWIGTSDSTGKPFYFTLALYDVAGEDYENGVDAIEYLQNKTDKIALVIDATHLIDSRRSIAVDDDDFLRRQSLAKTGWTENLESLQNLEKIGKPFCVILTIADLFIQYLKTNSFFEDEFQREFVDSFNDYRLGNQEKIRKLLRMWKAALSKIKVDPYPHNLFDLLDELIALNAKNPIFMVETHNLPKPPDDLVTNAPISYGLDSFVCWCLGVERDEIIGGRTTP